MTSASIVQQPTRGPSRDTAIQEYDGPDRVRLKPEAGTSGYVDGAWWPRTRNLALELPALLTFVGACRGRIERVSYNLTAWDSVGKRIVVAGAVVRLSGFHSQHHSTIDLLTARQRITLLVVPPEASPQAAYHVLTTAGHTGNADSIERLLVPLTLMPRAAGPDNGDAAALQRWELDGGRADSRTEPGTAGS